jgi:5-formyltetrahydrofolate cyclo-ligase
VRSKLASQLNALVAETGAKTVAAYLPFGTEPDIGGFLEEATDADFELIMPVSLRDGSLEWVVFSGAKAPGIFGFDEPVGEPAQLTSADLILVPASAADQTGARLGKGKGFYDRALADLSSGAKTAAIVYDQELLERVPTEPHDRPVDFVVTPERTVPAGQRP